MPRPPVYDTPNTPPQPPAGAGVAQLLSGDVVVILRPPQARGRVVLFPVRTAPADPQRDPGSRA